MVSKKGVFVFCLLVSLIFVSFAFAQDLSGKITETFGEADETGFPKSFSEYVEKARDYKARNDDREFIRKSLFGYVAETPVMRGIVYYTHKFFSFFDPLWRYTFGMEFDWNLAFFAHISIWIILIVFIFYPASVLFGSGKMASLVIAAIIASLAGSTGIIGMAVDQLEVMVTNLWIFLIAVVITIIVVALYIAFFRKAEEESKEEDVERAKESIRAHGKVSQKALEEFGDGGGI
ncbi:hypothetical protein CMI42_04605 [Candidatus Pacearchaeota archaeon]|nr:hypothetical protein [Candidatus Pacearchaeota archaeon]|tara:strand:+ start:1319 stop:2020 length:702 start_codon:yes stop_codon:yes gene_type:complete